MDQSHNHQKKNEVFEPKKICSKNQINHNFFANVWLLKLFGKEEIFFLLLQTDN